jgi:aspartyl-tRNA(Asn)/glutamyl-tRNA(Gln) amidotransferase subunit A
MDGDADERSQIRAFAAELGFDLDDDELTDEILGVVRTLEESVANLDEPIPETGSVGSWSDDEYGALLDVYEEPRSEADDGPLSGLTFAVKDVIAVEGLRLTLGSADFEPVPSYDAVAVERVLDAGGAIVGKANTDKCAIGPTGEFSERRPVTNPTVPDRVPGGSSSGPAAAVAGGLVDAALGTDTGGSVRIPAACCGLVGMKPTHGLVPRYGLQDLAPSADTIGPLARDVETVARTLEVMAGYDPRDPTSSHVDVGSLTDGLDDPGSVTIGVPESFLDATAEPVVEVIERLVDRLGGRPEVTVRRVDLDLGEITNAHPLLSSPELAWLLRQSFVVRGQGTQYEPEWSELLDGLEFNDHIALRKVPSAYVDAKTGGKSYAVGRKEEIRFERHLDEQFEDLDVLLTPTLRDLPPKRDRTGGSHEGVIKMTGNTGPISRVGFPVVSVPAGDVDGVPVGAQLVAPAFDDGTALQCARLVERTRSGAPTSE